MRGIEAKSVSWETWDRRGWVVSNKVFDSMCESVPYCDYFWIYTVECLDKQKPMVFRVKSLFLLDAKKLLYIFDTLGADQMKFNEETALEMGAAINLLEVADGGTVLSKSFAGMHRSDGQEITRLSEPQLLGSAS